jgi:hypothetical protein
VKQRIKEHPYHQLPILGDDHKGLKLAGRKLYIFNPGKWFV